MPNYNIYPAVDENYNFPPQIRQAITSYPEISASIERIEAAERILDEAQKGLEAQLALVEGVREELKAVEEVTIPNAISSLEEADAAAAGNLDILNTRLEESKTSLENHEEDLTTLKNKTMPEALAAAVGNFIKVSTDQVTAGEATVGEAVINKLWADGLASKTIDTNRLIVATGNLIPDGTEMLSDIQWRSMRRDTVDKPMYLPAARWADYPFHEATSIGKTPFPVVPGVEYVLETWIKADKPNSHFFMELRDTTTNARAGKSKLEIPYTENVALYSFFPNDPVPTEWTLYRGTWTPDEGVSRVHFGQFYLNHQNGTERTASIGFAGFSMRPKIGAVLIEDGAITTPKLNVTEEMVAKLVKAMAMETKQLIVTEGANITNAKLIGDTWAESLTATKIIGEDGVFNGTVDFANVNVTGEAIISQLSGQTITGVDITGSTLSSKTVSGASIEIADKVWANTYPGIKFYENVSGLTAHPTIATPVDGDQSGWVPGTLVGQGGTVPGGWINRWVLTPYRSELQTSKKLNGIWQSVSSVKTERELAIISNDEKNVEGELLGKSYVSVRPNEVVLQRDINVSPSSVGTTTHALSIDNSGIKAKAWTIGNNGETLQYRESPLVDEGWKYYPVSGWMMSEVAYYRVMNNTVYWRGILWKEAGLNAGWNTIGIIPSHALPTGRQLRALPTSTNFNLLIQITPAGALEAWANTKTTNMAQVHLSSLQYPVS